MSLSFDWKNAALDKSMSLEASAGTGKTYTLERLVYRFIVEKELPLESILVVTFTNKATRELEERIRKLLWDQWKKAEGREEELLRRACMDFDNASIYTIHSFCKWVLSSFAFEMGIPFSTEMRQDQGIQREELRDWFRRNQYKADLLMQGAFRIAMLSGDFEALLGELLQLQTKYATLSQGKIIPDERCDEAFLRYFEEGEAHPLIQGCRKWLKELDRNHLPKQFKEEGVWEAKSRKTAPKALRPWLELEKISFDPDWILQNSDALFENLRCGLVEGTSPFAQAHRELAGEVEKLDHLWGSSWSHTLILRFKLRLLEDLHRRREAGWKDLRVYRYDDLIDGVHRALCGEEEGEELLCSLRERFSLLLIDEFQDTDQRQWDIFSRIFTGSSRQQFVLIGDPKQSIYRFRGADLNVYFKAVESVPPEQRFQLGSNYRSTPSLVELFNHLFDPLFNHQNHSIRYLPVEAGAPDTPSIHLEGEELPALRFIRLESHEKSNVGLLREQWMEAIADEAARLLQQGCRLEGRPLNAGDMAILMEDNPSCLKMQSRLQARGIPSVVSSERTIFNSPAFDILQHFLIFLANPSDRNTLRYLLLSPLFGLTAQELVDVEAGEGLERISLQARLWTAQNAALEELFELLGNCGKDLAEYIDHPEAKSMLERPALERLLVRKDGERLYTDILHLLDLFQREKSRNSLDFHGLAYLAESKELQARLEGETQVRLEKEGQVVQIMTHHSSKGLQFPLVFFSGGLKTSSRKQEFISYTQNSQLHYSALYGKEEQAQAEEEAWLERIKLYYVAFTRAKSHLYLPLFPRWEKALISRMYRCFLGEGDGSTPQDNSSEALLEALMRDYPRQVDCRDYTGAAVAPLPRPEEDTLEPARLLEAPFSGRCPSMSSFSALTRGPHVKELVLPEDLNPDSGEDPLQEEELPESLQKRARDLPGGADLGNLVHSCFEEMDFSWAGASGDQDRLDTLLAELSRSWFTPAWYLQWKDPLKEMVLNALNYPLEELGGLCLYNLPAQQKRHELEFHMANRGGSIHLGGERWNIEPGFLKGFLDLIFLWEGKYYILDWKTTSNPEHPAQGGYSRDILDSLMTHHHYPLQAMIYWSALSRYLRQIQGDRFRPESMGGIYYFFLRGMDTPGEGVWFHRPDDRELEEFESTFLEVLP